MAPHRLWEGYLSDKKKLLIIMDTSALLYPFQKRIDFIRRIEESLEIPYEIAVTKGTVRELQRLAISNRPKLAMASRKALMLCSKLRILPSEGNLPEDEELMKLANEMKAAVATADSELRMKLKKTGATVIFIARGRRIIVDNKPFW